jgi:uncharacterized membrane protein
LSVVAAGTGVIMIVVAVAVVLVVLLVTVSKRGRQTHEAERRGEARRDVEEARDEGDGQSATAVSPGRVGEDTGQTGTGGS